MSTEIETHTAIAATLNQRSAIFAGAGGSTSHQVSAERTLSHVRVLVHDEVSSSIADAALLL